MFHLGLAHANQLPLHWAEPLVLSNLLSIKGSKNKMFDNFYFSKVYLSMNTMNIFSQFVVWDFIFSLLLMDTLKSMVVFNEHLFNLIN